MLIILKQDGVTILTMQNYVRNHVENVKMWETKALAKIRKANAVIMLGLDIVIIAITGIIARNLAEDVGELH